MIPIPEELLEQLERGNVLLFIGERIVRNAEGQAVVDPLTARLAARCDVADEGTLSFPEAAQAYEDEKGRQALIQFLRDQLDEQSDAPQQAHRLISGLTDCDVLAATCLDRRLERAFEQAKRPLDVITGNVDVAFEDERNAQLYKLRGSLDRPESLVLTEDDYEAFFEDQASISVVLQGYLARKTILFVGYDLADPHFKRLYRKVTAPLDDYARRAYAFGESPSPRVCRWCERHGVEVVEANATAFLESLGEQLAARVRPIPTVPPQPVQDLAASLPERPYKLLDYYEAQDAAIFFGRQDETQHLTSLIHAHRLVLLYGASGTGKTSLLMAGVAPRLERADPPYEILYVRALEDPALVIRRALRRRLPEAGLPKDSSLVDFLDAATRALDRTLVILLDQFEEFFIRLSPEFRAAFVAELGALYDARDLPVKVVLSLRGDWLESVEEIERRIPEVYRIKARLLPLTRDQAHMAITAPVERLGVRYEPALVERLLDDLSRGQGLTSAARPSDSGGAGIAVMPPQLQLVCSALYDGLGPDERLIPLAAYERLGGARGVLQKCLDDELARLGSDERALARSALEELVTSQHTKAVKSGDELVLALGVDPAQLTPVLEKLVHARLLRPVEHAEAAERAYELAHEYLIAEIALSPEAMARKAAEELLAQELSSWRAFGTLINPGRLQIIETWCAQPRLSQEARELIEQSREQHAQDKQALSKVWLDIRLNAIGQLVAGIAHEINTPVGSIKANSYFLKKIVPKIKEHYENLPQVITEFFESDQIQVIISKLRYARDDQTRELAEKCALEQLNYIQDYYKRVDMLSLLDDVQDISDDLTESSARITDMIRNLARFVRFGETDLVTTDVHEIINSTYSMLRAELKQRANVEKHYGNLPQLPCYPNQLGQAILSILQRAIKALELAPQLEGEKGRIQIETYQENEWAVIAIKDSGRGIDPENLDKIFEPDFTMKGLKVGVDGLMPGMGLPIAKQVIETLHLGRIEVESEVGKGSTFFIKLPLER